jgi:predicted enzyme related to lactoylglutathione lyase
MLLRLTWQTQMFGAEMGNYVLATTTETDESRRPKVIAVDDIQAAMRQVTEAGGNVLGEPVEIPGVGQYVSFFDTEGNRVSMLQPIPRG